MSRTYLDISFGDYDEGVIPSTDGDGMVHIRVRPRTELPEFIKQEIHDIIQPYFFEVYTQTILAEIKQQVIEQMAAKSIEIQDVYAVIKSNGIDTRIDKVQ